jgi:hypothetical protein
MGDVAVTASPVHAESADPVGTFTVDTGAAFWRPSRTPAAGDLVILSVLKPASVLAGPSGWTAVEDGRSFWRIYGPREPETVTFHARGVREWEVKGWVVQGGTYELPEVT